MVDLTQAEEVELVVIEIVLIVNPLVVVDQQKVL